MACGGGRKLVDGLYVLGVQEGLMSSQPQRLRLLTWLAVLALALAGCGGSGGTSTNPLAMGQPQMRLSVADAPPADGAPHVVVVFTGVELTGNDGNPVTINFSSPKSIDLVTQSGTATAVLFDQPIPSGSYGQVRLMVQADGSANNSFIVLADGSMHGLRVPSGAETGLKLVSGFTVPSSGVVDYTIDFDLRQAITCPPGQGPACLLKPALRLVDNTTVGNIQGQITSTLPAGCTPGVYLYGGTVTRPEDMNSGAPSTDSNQPLASKAPVATTSPPYYYQFTFLAPGTYTVAFTCQAAKDNPVQADASVILIPVGTTAVTANATQTVNIALGAIQGAVASALVTSTCTSPGVYLYSGSVTSPEDFNSSAPATDMNQPVTAQLPVATSSPAYSYLFTALPPGTYTLAFTCQAADDNPAQADASVTFGKVVTGIVVAADQTTMADIS
jgi:hypothetical protein